MQNAICFSTKFGWITATEQKNKVTSIHFKKSSKQGKTSFLLNKLKSDINLFFKGETKLINLPLKIDLGNVSSYFNTGDWINHYSFIIYDGKNVELKYFKK